MKMGIGIGWPNATSGGSAPISLESYAIYSCSGEESLISEPYQVGSFVPGNRIGISGTNYGYIESVIPESTGETISNFPIGPVDYTCNDSDIYLSVQFQQIGNNCNFTLYGYMYPGSLSVISNVNPLSVDVLYYIPFIDEFGSSLIRSGTKTIQVNTYNVPVDVLTVLQSEFVFTVPSGYTPEYIELSVTNVEIGNIYNSPYDTGWEYPNKYVTNYGNVWTFFWPTSP